MQVSAAYTNRSVISLAILAVLFAMFAIALEAGLRVPLRLPGHRAFPGALAVILFAEVATPYLLLAFSVAIPAVLVVVTRSDPLMIVPWVILALILIGLKDIKYRRCAWLLILLGLLFGALRFGILMEGFHQTPQFIRCCGHLIFGGLGGASASLIVTIHRQKENHR